MGDRYRGLVPFKSGDEWNGNRNGRPKGSVSLTTLIKRTLAGDTVAGQKTPDGRPVAEWLVDAMIKQAMKGNSAFMKEIIDRNDGPVPRPEPEPDVSIDDILDESDRIADTLEDEAGGAPGPVEE